MDIISTLGLALGASWASGLRLYAVVATLGLLGRYTSFVLPGELSVLTNGIVISVAVVLLVVEFVADKVPLLDTGWDAVHTFLRVPAGAAIGLLAFGDYDPAWQAVALLLGGGVALTAHGSKAATRLAVNTSPEPFSNMAVSTAEDGLAIGAVLLAVFLPVVAIVGVVVAVGATLFMAPKVIRALRRLSPRDATS